MSRVGWLVTALGVVAYAALCIYLAVANGTGVCVS